MTYIQLAYIMFTYYKVLILETKAINSEYKTE